MTQLRPYQQRAVDELRDAYRRGKRRPLFVLPTGGGKTIVASHIIQSAGALGNRSLFVAPRRELIGQTVHKLADAGIWDVRVIQAANDTGRPDAPVIVGSIQTLTLPRWLGRLPAADLVIADEAHHLASDQWGKLSGAYPSARWLGLTATPERADGRALGDVFDEIVVGASVSELMELHDADPAIGLVRCRVFGPPIGELESGELALDPVAAYQQHGDGGLAVVFCVTVKHAEQTADAFNAAGIPAALVHGQMPAIERAAILGNWPTGTPRVVCNVGVLTEGFDLPALSVCILARRFGHAGLYLQCVGRTLRPSPGKQQATVIDLCGSSIKHGPPDMPREYSLTGKAIRSGSSRDIIRQCPTCAAVFLAGPLQCPQCGAELPRREIEIPRSTGVGVVDLSTMPKLPQRTYTLSITAKFPGYCRSCNGRITPGEQIWWARGDKPKHIECPTAPEAAWNQVLP